ncbi:reverse transcriptase domain-containing protein [Ralstonia mannitolilytica]|uniref:reverse transcriptase domain-containing protein n=1 Tax=Ralstonia mannitolilytica TaxID=105219 RepID=UPI00292CF032|nr:reverse transcriptase domain-containing protein [Ralstonia mannitolilytica]
MRNASLSTSEETRSKADIFKKDFEKNLENIRKKLTGQCFKFSAAKGVAIPKSGKSGFRPVVIAPIEDRIVQRAILDTLSDQPFVREIQRKEYNFGGIIDGGVAKSLRRAYKAGITHSFYVRTDIKDFFTNVPRDKLLSCVTNNIADPEFNKLIEAAATVELSNLDQLKKYGNIFPLGENGVAQGSCLSPMLCNLLMHELDEFLNTEPFQAVRYIDDVIIFGPNRSQVRKRLREFKARLRTLGLDAYDPPPRGAKHDGSAKAAEGETAKGFSFLGCEVTRTAIRPGPKARKSLIEKVRGIYERGIASQRHIVLAAREAASTSDHPSVLYTLWRVSNTVRAWGGAFSFCTDTRIFHQLDISLFEEYQKFRKGWRARINGESQANIQRSLGIQLLEDIPLDDDFLKLVASQAS